MPPALAVAAALAVRLTLGQTADPDTRDVGPSKLDVSGYPPEQQSRYPMFAAKCSKCHPLARPINATFDPPEWKRYLKRMIRRPNSGINEEQAQQIYEFLKFYSMRNGWRER